MSIQYTATQGDCLSSIAKQYAFADWRTIYNHPLNDQLRELRPDPNVIFPGDVINIPDKDPRTETCATTRAHTFRLTRGATRLRLKLQDVEGQLITGRKYKLTIGSAVFEESIPDDGLIDKPIQPDDTTGELLVWTIDNYPEPDRWQLKLGELDPVETISGVQARLNNLGYASGPVDGADGPLTQAAVREFQKDNSLTVDGIAGPQTQSALKDAYGC